MARTELLGEHNVIGCNKGIIFYFDPELVEPVDPMTIKTPCESGGKKRTITNTFEEGMYIQAKGCEGCRYHKPRLVPPTPIKP
jgi:hypothetical protein